MKYYYLKVGSSNCLAKQWLDGKNPVAQRPAVVVFFGKADEKCSQKKYSSEEYKRMGLSSKRGGYQLNQLESFYNACDRPNCSRFVVVAEKLWILTPKGKVERQELGGLDLEDLVTWYGLEIKKRQPKGKTFDEERKKFLENEFHLSTDQCQVCHIGFNRIGSSWDKSQEKERLKYRYRDCTTNCIRIGNDFFIFDCAK